MDYWLDWAIADIVVIIEVGDNAVGVYYLFVVLFFVENLYCQVARHEFVGELPCR